jgi:hypothetical protein
MKKNFSSLSGIIILLTIISCNNNIVPLKGNYQDKPYEFVTSSSKDQIWDKLIDFLIAKGLAIKTIDKNSGVITTDNTSFINSYTWESKDGSLVNTDAFVVCSKYRGLLTFGPSIRPEVITGQWTVRVKQNGDNTIVVTNLSNAAGKIVFQNAGSNGQGMTTQTYDLTVKSTGLFEKTIENALK